MPSSSDANPAHQPPKGPSPLSQAQSNAVAEQSSTRSGRKKGKATPSKVEKHLANEIPYPSPPLPPQRFRSQGAKEVESDKGHVTSPVLDALGTLEGFPDVDNASRTDVWARAVPLGKSPPVDLLTNHGISESPPSPPPKPGSGGFNSATPPSSPPQRKARPVSYGGQPVFSRQPSSEKHSKYGAGAQGFAQPPLPHLAQAHFYGAPDINLGFGQWNHERPEDEGPMFVGFDSMPFVGDARPQSLMACLLMGFQGRLDILSFRNEKLNKVGCLYGLKGDVVGAKILSWETGHDSFYQLRPLVAIIIHGPKIDEGLPHSESDSDGSEAVPNAVPRTQSGGQIPLPEYQTRVEVFSLATQKRVATLFQSQSAPAQPSFRGLPAVSPAPIGDLDIRAQGNYVVLSSGTSGEIFVYGISDARFYCLAKFWTTIQPTESRKFSMSSGSGESDASPADQHRGQSAPALPILALGGRWLAIAPPGSSSHPSLKGTIPLPALFGRVPGIETLGAPARPSPNCLIESPDAESMLNIIARGLAKEVVKGARWVGDQGIQAWNSYWNRDAPSSPKLNPTTRYPQAQEQMYPPYAFPPTHAAETQIPSTEPDLVSIMDLKALEFHSQRKAGEVLSPLATFQPPGGCSFLSFSPTGLSIMTATKKGDVQYIWDLMQLWHTRVAALISNSPASIDGDAHSSPRVRQVAKYARLSSSSIVDGIWTGPIGDRIAMLTRNRTIHIFDVPQSAFQWPPPRKVARQPPQSPGLSPSRASEPETSGGVFASAMKFAGKTQPMLANLRGRAPSMGGGFGNIASGGMGFASVTGGRTGKAVAAGLSKSVGAAATGTVSQIRHAGENRVHLSAMARDLKPGRMVWSVYNGEVAIAALDGDAVRTFRVKRREVATKQSQRSKVSVIDARRSIDTKLPHINQLAIPLGSGHSNEDDSSRAAGFLSLDQTTSKQHLLTHAIHPLSRAEIETNAPFQPFHSDRRVNLFVYDSKTVSSSNPPSISVSSSTHSQLVPQSSEGSVWVFGDDIPVTKLHLRPPSDDFDDEDHDPADPLGAGDQAGSTIIRQAQSQKMATQGEFGEVEQIVITTRRKRNKGGGQGTAASRMGNAADDLVMGDEDGFFEDDCEVLDFAGDRV